MFSENGVDGEKNHDRREKYHRMDKVGDGYESRGSKTTRKASRKIRRNLDFRAGEKCG